MKANVLVNTLSMGYEEWLEYRKYGIGGSDAATILGLNPWKSLLSLYLEKTGEKEDSIDSEAAYWGITLEDVVAKEFEKRTGLKVRRRNAILQHPEHKFMLANIDREIVGKKEGLEVKTTSEYNKSSWEGDNLPDNYYCQVQHYMAVTGYDAWWIAVLIGGNKFEYKKVEKDEKFIELLIQEEEKFWNQVQNKIPPEVDGSQDAKELLNQLYPEAKKESVIELPELQDTLTNLELVKIEEKEIKGKKELLEQKIKEKMGGFETAYIGDKKVTWKNVVSKRFDSKKFEKENPTEYEKYINISTSRRLNV